MNTYTKKNNNHARDKSLKDLAVPEPLGSSAGVITDE